MTKVVKKRKISFQKIFNLISAAFILACCVFYGTRFIKLYYENNKELEINTLTNDIMNNNHNNSNFKNLNGIYYFSGKEESNYLKYSNLLWRIIRINEDKSITVVLDNSITALAAGPSKSFEESKLNKWLNYQNEEYTGILQNNLNNIDNYLSKTSTCNDIISDTKKISCDSTTENLYITLPSINDYINTGGKDSFMNDQEYFYLINYNSNNKIWCVNKDGKIGTSDKTDIYGIKPVITLKSTVSIVSGEGTKDNPYKFENEDGLFGSYVKLGQDIWQINNVDNNLVQLSLNNYLKYEGEEITHKYSDINYYHNDTIYGSLAYYLNNSYYNSLNYKNILTEQNFSNGLYSNNTDYDYIKVLKTTVSTKIAPLSIGDIILNPILTNYYLSTGISENNDLIYTMNNDFNINTKTALSELKIVPTIKIKKELLTKGNGSIDTPYEVK